MLDDIREIRLDKALKELLNIDKIPTARAFTEYLHKYGTDGEDAIKKIILIISFLDLFPKAKHNGKYEQYSHRYIEDSYRLFIFNKSFESNTS